MRKAVSVVAAFAAFAALTVAAPAGVAEAAPYSMGGGMYCSIQPTPVNNGTPLKSVCPSPHGYYFDYSACVWWEGYGWVKEKWTVRGRVQRFTYGTVFGPYSHQTGPQYVPC